MESQQKPAFTFKTFNSSQDNQISILSYNVLAEVNVNKWFPHCPEEYLNFKHRSSEILKQIQELNPDIVCLQEVDNFDNIWQPGFKKLGYQSFHSPRKQEGVALAFRESRFKLISKEILKYQENIPQYLGKDENYLRPETALIFILKDTKTELEFCIANTHLFWNPKFDHVKYYQFTRLLEVLNKNFDSKYPIFICGDLNSLPTSNIVQSVTNKVPPQLSRCEFDKILIKDCQELYKRIMCRDSENMEYSLGMDFKNPYSQYTEEKQYPPLSTFSKTWYGFIDHIFYNSKNEQIQVQKIIELPGLEEMQKNGPLPSKFYPSDHLPVMVVFNILSTPKL